MLSSYGIQNEHACNAGRFIMHECMDGFLGILKFTRAKPDDQGVFRFCLYS